MVLRLPTCLPAQVNSAIQQSNNCANSEAVSGQSMYSSTHAGHLPYQAALPQSSRLKVNTDGHPWVGGWVGPCGPRPMGGPVGQNIKLT